ncbi:MAG: hypothetical protein JW959_00475 [Pirellulales bacterium]|nr:hypothetical protein [Pirellulales bacterium]
MNEPQFPSLKLKTAVISSAAHAWLVYCSASFLFALAFLILDGDNPLQSDDPYIVGFTFGVIGACHSLFYSMVEAFTRGNRPKHVIWFIAMVLWCAFLCLAWWNALEGQGMILSILFGSLIVAAIEWPLLYFRTSRAAYITASVIGVTQIGLYLYVATQVMT